MTFHYGYTPGTSPTVVGAIFTQFGWAGVVSHFKESGVLPPPPDNAIDAETGCRILGWTLDKDGASYASGGNPGPPLTPHTHVLMCDPPPVGACTITLWEDC